MNINRSINELERLGFKFWPIGSSNLHYEFTGQDPGSLPAGRVRALFKGLSGRSAEVIEHLRTRHRPAARWVPQRVYRIAKKWPLFMWPITLYRGGEEVVFKDIEAVARRTLPGEIWSEGDDIVVMLDYSPKLVAQLKALPRRRWDQGRRVWTVQQDYRANLDSIMLDHYGVSLAEAMGERHKTNGA